MKPAAIIMSVLLSSFSFAVAQGNPSGPGALTGDPAASTAKPSADPAKTRGQSNNPSGSGTSPLAVKTTMETRGVTRCRRVT